MKKTAIALTALAFSAGIASAADDPIEIREALMEANGGAAGLSAGMLKGEIPYSPTAAKAALATFHGTALAFGNFFPEDSKTGGDTTASPKIWEDAEGFREKLAEFQADATAGFEAAGKDGPADLAAFKEAVMPVLQNCKGCHETYRIKK